MKSAANIIYQLLIDEGLAIETEGDWQGFVSFFPETPDNAICVVDTAGMPDGRLMGSGERIEHPGFQVTVRGLSYTDTLTKVQEISNVLDAVQTTAVTVDQTSYTLESVTRTGCVIPLGIEELENRRRFLFTINATVTI